MNNLTKESTGLSKSDFTKYVKYFLDDYETICEEHQKHNTILREVVTEINLESATEICKEFSLSIPPSDLVGYWFAILEHDTSWGTSWDCVDFLYRVVETTETKTVTYWKRVLDAEPAQKESVPARPGS